MFDTLSKTSNKWHNTVCIELNFLITLPQSKLKIFQQRQCDELNVDEDDFDASFWAKECCIV